MKKLRRYLPVLILILALIILFAPARNDGSTAYTAESPGAGSGGGELQLLDPAPDEGGQTGSAESTDNPAGLPGGDTGTQTGPEAEPQETLLPEEGSYTTKEDVALYLVTYGHLPENFVTKAEAEKAGWNGGSLEYVLPGKCIGGDRFGNREGQLPKAKGRTWRECDINTLGRRSRGAERLVYSSDGLIYYTPDHYETFTRLY